VAELSVNFVSSLISNWEINAWNGIFCGCWTLLWSIIHIWDPETTTRRIQLLLIFIYLSLKFI